MKKIVILSVFLFLTGCTSVASSTMAYFVAKNAEKIERDTRRYSKINACFVNKNSEPYVIGGLLAHGTPLAEKYSILLNPEFDDIDPPQPHHLAYAYYYVAKRIGDMRALSRLKWLQPYMEEGKAKEIEEYINQKYYQSYLKKCFFVDRVYKETLSGRDLIFRD